MRRKGAGTMFILAVVGIPLLLVFFLAVMLSGSMTPGESINILKVQEQGGTELFSLLNQEDCVDGVPFKEVIAAGILQNTYDDVPVYKPDNTMEEADLRGCIDDYMDYLRKHGPRSVLPACTQNWGSSFDPIVHPFFRRICGQEVTYILNIRHGSCRGENELCFAHSGNKPDDTRERIARLLLFGIPGHFLFAAADGIGFVIQKELIAVPGENPAIAILSLRRESA